MNPKLMKFAAKGIIGIVFSAAIGYMIKVEKKVEEHIDDYYDPKPDDKQEN